MRTPWPRGRRTRLCHKHARPYHPQTCGKFERFHQTLKKYLAKQPAADSLEALQAQLDRFVLYNESRPHRALGWRTPREVFDAKIKARPQGATPATHFRVRHAQVDRHGKVTLRYDSKLFHIGLGARHKGLPVVLLVANRDVRVVSSGRRAPASPHARSGPDELRRRSQLTFDLDAQEVGPERSQALGIRAVDLYPPDSSDGLTTSAISHASRDYWQQLLT